MTSKASVPGKKVAQGEYSAFVLEPLPPIVAWTPRLIRVLSDADRLVGRLAGLADYPILMCLMRPCHTGPLPHDTKLNRQAG